jgi:peptidoglycan/LPS O-acetylase OafA/YrhL
VRRGRRRRGKESRIKTGAGFRPDIEGLRGLAVLLVVVFHAGLGPGGGFVGVDVFFVISGFLITGLLLRERQQTGRIDFVAFYARRVRRLLPAALVVLLVTLPLAYLLFDPLDRGQVVWDGAASALSVGNIRFALAEGDYFANLAAPSPFLHFWSLGVEEQFYLVWPALLAFAMSARHARRGAWLALFDVFLASLTAAVLLTSTAPNWAFYSLPTRAFELAAGGLLAVAAPAVARLPGWLVGPVGWSGAAAVIVSAFTFDASMAFPGALALVPTLGSVGMIAAGMRGGRWLSPTGLLSTGPLRFLGRISYSLYLWHWPIFVLAGMAFGFGREPGLLIGIWLIGMSIGVSMLSWALIEEPFRRGIRLPRPFRLPIPQFRPGLTVIAGLAGIVSVVLVANSLAVAADSSLRHIGQGAPPPPTAEFVPVEADPTDPPDTADADPTDPPAVILPNATPWPADETQGPRPSAIALPTDSPDPTAGPKPTANTDATPKPTADSTPKPTAKPTPQPTLSDYALSADVQPALVDARGDKEKLWFDHCLGIESTTTPRNCVYGDTGASYTVALVGDSHGSAMFPAFEWMAQRNGWRLLTFVKVACPFLDIPVESMVLKREYTECAQWNENVIARLNAAPPDLTVINMSHWIFPVDTSLGMSDFSASLTRMIGRLSGKTVILADTPHSAVDVPACLSANWWDIRPCATRKAQAMSQHGVLEGAAASAAGVALIDLAAKVCPSGPCQPVIDNMIVYRDSHHLTATFSRSLGRDLAALIDIVR